MFYESKKVWWLKQKYALSTFNHWLMLPCIYSKVKLLFYFKEYITI